KSVLITGASQGMGRATAELFAREGAKIAICARNETTLANAAEKIKRDTGAEVLARALDVTDPARVTDFVAEVASRFGRIDVCVANAGGPPARSFSNSSLDDWRKSFDLNFMSVVYLAKQVIPHMQRNKWGRFITITSTSVRQPIPDLILSSAIRPAVVGL